MLDNLHVLQDDGIQTISSKNTSQKLYNKVYSQNDFKPNYIIDDGCDLVAQIHQNYPELIPNIIGSTEETTSTTRTCTNSTFRFSSRCLRTQKKQWNWLLML